MDRGALLGIIGGAVVFIIILSFIIYTNSDFDRRLIEQVDNQIPAEKLIPQIDNETVNLKTIAKKHLISVVYDRKYWGNGELAIPKDYQGFIVGYDSEMKIISDIDYARKRFARREITEKEFLSLIKGLKEFFNVYRTL